MARLFSSKVGVATAAMAMLLGVSALGQTQMKPGGQALPKELSLHAGSKSCIECHGKFYQLWATSRHGLAMQPYTPVFARANLTPQTKLSLRQVI
jgi:hypothetical protein